MIARTHRNAVRERNGEPGTMEAASDEVPSAAPWVYAKENTGIRHRSCVEGTFRSTEGPSLAFDRHEFSIRTFDIVTSAAILLAAWPVLLIGALLVKLTSPGAVIYRQPRVGRHHKVFTLYKLRTMTDGAERDTGPVWASAQDRRITPVGRILRSTRIDELPQLFNVLRGDMSLVGPRPERPCFVARFEVLQGTRLAVKPGITGLAQIRGPYDLRPDRKVRYDILYIQNRSIRLNLYVLFQTIPVVFLRKGW